MAVWSVEAITKFIRLYREHPCLWKIKSKEYTNRNMRNKAYDELVDFCKSVGFVSADRDFVSKKIQNLRGAFRKELKKVTETRNKSGSSQEDVYKPTLWYFDLLLFTKDQELPTPSVSNMPTNESTAETLDYFANHTPSPQHYTNDDIPTSQQPTNITSLPNSDHTIVEESSSSLGSASRGMKRKTKPSVIDTQIKFMTVWTEALKKKEVTEYDALAITISKKMEKMNSIQALHAKTIIHSVLRRGILNQLTDSIDICDKQCNKTVILSSPSSSTSVHTDAAQHSTLQPTLETLNTDETLLDESQCVLRDYYKNFN